MHQHFSNTEVNETKLYIEYVSVKLLPTSTRHGDISNQFFQKSTIGFKCYRGKLEKSLLI